MSQAEEIKHATTIGGDLSTCDASHEVFGVRDTHCKILSFLDLRCLLRCQRVSREWQDHVNDPSNVYCLDLNDCIKAAGKSDGMKSISRFRHARGLVWCLDFDQWRWQTKNSTVFEMVKELTQFNKLEFIELHLFMPGAPGARELQAYRKCLLALVNALTKSRASVKRISITSSNQITVIKQSQQADIDMIMDIEDDRDANIDDDFSDDDDVEDVDYSLLRTNVRIAFRELSDMVVKSNYQNLENLHLHGFHCESDYVTQLLTCQALKLKSLSLGQITLDISLESWREIVSHKKFGIGLSTLEELKLDVVDFTDDWKLFKKEIVPQISKHMLNLKKIDALICDDLYLYFMYHVSKYQDHANSENVSCGIEEVKLHFDSDDTTAFDDELHFNMTRLKRIHLKMPSKVRVSNIGNMLLLFGSNLEHLVLDSYDYYHEKDIEFWIPFLKQLDAIKFSHLSVFEMMLDIQKFGDHILDYLNCINMVANENGSTPLLKVYLMNAMNFVLTILQRPLHKWFHSTLVQFSFQIPLRPSHGDSYEKYFEPVMELQEAFKLSRDEETTICKMCEKHQLDLHLDQLYNACTKSDLYTIFSVNNCTCFEQNH